MGREGKGQGCGEGDGVGKGGEGKGGKGKEGRGGKGRKEEGRGVPPLLSLHFKHCTQSRIRIITQSPLDYFHT